MNISSTRIFTRSGFAVAFAALMMLAPARLQAQTIYTSMNGGGAVDKVSPGGAITTFATGLTAPKGVAFDADGNLYVAEDFSGASQSIISKVTPDGTVSTFATGFLTPIGLAFDGSGNLFVGGIL